MSLLTGPVNRRLGLIVRLALLTSLALSPTSMVAPVSAATTPALTPRPAAAAKDAPPTASSAPTPVPTATPTKRVAPQLSPGCTTDVTKPYPQAVLKNSPVVYYRLGEANGPTACDASGNSHDGQYQAGVTWGTKPAALVGDVDAAVTNPGIGAGVLQSGATLPAGDSARTIEGWVRQAGGGSGNRPIIASYGRGDAYGGWFAVTFYCDICPSMTVWTGNNGAVGFPLPHGWQDAFWHHFAITYDPTLKKMVAYMDGAVVGSADAGPLNTAIPGNGAQLAYQTINQSVDYDEIAIYPTALSPTDIAKHWTVGKGTGPYMGPETYGGGNICIPCAINKALHAIFGNPVDTATGDMYHTFSDLAIPGRGLPLAFTRTYNSLAAGSTGPLGYGWTYSYNVSLSLDGQQNATIFQENGSQTTFINNGGTYAPATPHIIATLVHNPDGTWTFTRQAQAVLTFSSTG